MIPDQHQDEGSIVTGIGIGFGLNAIVFTVLVVIGSNSAQLLLAGALAIGLTQLIYMIPLCLHYRKTGQKNTAKGIIIIGSITALLNATCWGLVWNMRF